MYVGGLKHDMSLDPTTGTIAGLRLGYDFTSYIGGELGWGLSNNDVNRISKIDGQKIGDIEEINDFESSFYGSLVIHLMPKGWFVPFLTGGIGMIYLDSEGPESQTQFAWNTGAGIKIFLTRRFAFRTDVRNFSLKPKNTGDRLNFLEASGGLTWYFGRK
jgi:outer membrane beta-barrel protein